MNFLDEVRADRQSLADVLKKHSGIRKIVEELYPDNAHFIYELLQNAEDTGATEVCFTLTENYIIFEHNGRPFNEKDIWGITDIGEGTKDDSGDKIGRFGVGFKAVFDYSETPKIWSPSYSFIINDLVLPTAIYERTDLEMKTCFEFPFNSPKKDAKTAYKEIKSGLKELAETTLLFLNNINSIKWEIKGIEKGNIVKIIHKNNHVEIKKNTEIFNNKIVNPNINLNIPNSIRNKNMSNDVRSVVTTISHHETFSSHYLCFSKTVSFNKNYHVAIAFRLKLNGILEFDPLKPIYSQMKIVPVNIGTVAVFFPAKNETSGLRFHLHAPFITGLDRASVKDTPANDSLFKEIAALSAESLHNICKSDLLTIDFLNILPNDKDSLPKNYQIIRSTILNEMNNKPLTPTYSKTHAPAKQLLQSRASLKRLLSNTDIEFLVDYDNNPPSWAAAAPQNNSNADRFLSSLAIKEWSISHFIEILYNKTNSDSWHDGIPINISKEEFINWLIKKSPEWLQDMYLLLDNEISGKQPREKSRIFDAFKKCKIVRLNNSKYVTGDSCYFPFDGIKDDEIFPRVNEYTYSSKSKIDNEITKNFLKLIGVRDVGEAEQIQVIIQQRYTNRNLDPNIDDIKSFISFLEKNPEKTDIFARGKLIKCINGEWKSPSMVYIDTPYRNTGLKNYYSCVSNNIDVFELSDEYLKFNMNEQIIKFIQKIGVQTKLSIKDSPINKHPYAERNNLDEHNQYGFGTIQQYRGEDWTLPCCEQVLHHINLEAAKLIWNTMSEETINNTRILKAYFENKNLTGPSKIIWLLRHYAWVPQKITEFEIKFVLPHKAIKALLPDGFPCHRSKEWLDSINFAGEDEQRIQEMNERDQQARTAGFKDYNSLERALKFAELSSDEQERVLATIERHKEKVQLPEKESTNRGRRDPLITGDAIGAPLRETTRVERSVSNSQLIKPEVEAYLRFQYTNEEEGIMFCQICKNELPFKLDDDKYYFESVELLSKDELKQLHKENYIALCPNHSAMFMHANGSKDKLKDIITQAIIKSTENNIPIILAREEETIYFTNMHLSDLKTVIKAVETDENIS